MRIYKRIQLSNDEIEYIKYNCRTMSSTQIAMWIGCCPASVRYHINKLKLKCVNIAWNEDTVDMFKLYLKDYNCKQIASIMRTSTANLYMAVKRFKNSGVITGKVWHKRNEKYHGIS